MYEVCCQVSNKITFFTIGHFKVQSLRCHRKVTAERVLVPSEGLPLQWITILMYNGESNITLINLWSTVKL